MAEHGEETVETDGESSVIAELRKQNRELQRQLKGSVTPDDVEAEVEKRIARRDAVQGLLVDLGYNPKLSKLVLSNVDGDLESETVRGFLEGLGVEPQTASDDKGAQKQDSASERGRVGEFAARVSSAARRSPSDSNGLMEKLNAAKSPEEISKIMNEAGLSQ